MAEPYRFGANFTKPVRPGAASPGAEAAQDREEHAAGAFRPGALLAGTVLVLAGAAAGAWAWAASGRPVPEALRALLPQSAADISPATLGLLFLAALIVFGALATALLIGGALKRAFDPSLSGPYRTYVAFTLTAALLSGYTSMYGVAIEFLDPSQGFIRWRIFPVVVFFYCFLFVYLTWSWTFDLVIRSEPRRRWLIAIVIPLLAAIPIFAVSTTTSALGLAGPRILERRLLGWLDDYSDRLGDLSAYVGETESAALSLETFSGRMTQLSAQEAETGAITGFAGRGSVAAQMRVAAEDLGAGAALVRNETAERNFVIETMAEEIEATRADILDGDYFRAPDGAELPVRDWQDKVQAQERSLGRQWEQVANRAYVTAALGQIALLDSLIMNGGVSDSTAVAQAQRTAQAQVSSYLANSQQIVREELERAAAAPAPEPPGIAYQSPLLVLFRHWDQAILPWAIAISLDFGPWVWIALAAVAGYDRRRSRARYATPDGHHWTDEHEDVSGGRIRVVESRPDGIAPVIKNR